MPVTYFRVLGLKELQRAMDRRRAQMENRTRVNAQAVTLVDGWIQKNFAQQGKLSMGGDGWQPLKPATLARRRMGGKGAKILQDTGHLKTRWKHLWTASVAKIQSGVDYGAYHDNPRKPRKKLPLRRVLPTNKQIWPLLEKLYGNFLKRILK